MDSGHIGYLADCFPFGYITSLKWRKWFFNTLFEHVKELSAFLRHLDNAFVMILYTIFRICEIYRQACILALSLVGVRLVLGLELEGVGCRTQEHFTVMSMDG